MAPATLARNNREPDPVKFLATSGEGRKVVTFLKKQTIFTQGDAASTVFYVQDGTVRHTVISKFGKEATLGILSKGDFFGDDGLAGQSLRAGSAAAMTDCKLLQIDTQAMMLALHEERALSDLFVAHLLARNIRYQQDLVDQLFGSSEKRLAQVLLLQARFREEGSLETEIPNVNHETLAYMAGTTQVHVGSFMSRFRKSGFLAYSKGGLQIYSSLLSVVLRD